MKLKHLLIPIYLFVALSSCDEQKECCPEDEVEQMVGSWRLYERGYSPGGGYITEPIPADPPQDVTLKDGRLTSTIDGFSDLKYYKILTDSMTHTPILALYVNDPETGTNEVYPNVQTYSFDRSNNTLKLYFRYCIEGCHLAFKKIK